MGRSKRRLREISGPLDTSAKFVVKLQLDEQDYDLLQRNLPEQIQLEGALMDQATAATNDDSKKEEKTDSEDELGEESRAAVTANDSFLVSRHESEEALPSSMNTKEKQWLTSEMWFVGRTQQAVTRLSTRNDKPRHMGEYDTSMSRQSQYRMIRYEDMERLFLFGLGVVTKTPVAPIYKRPSRIPERAHFACFPIKAEEDFTVQFYFVNILSATKMNEKEFRVIVAMFTHMLGKFCFLPNRLIAITRKLDSRETEPFSVNLGGQKGYASIQFIPSGEIRGSSLDVKCAMVIHYFLIDLLRTVNLWSFGGRNFLWQESNVMDPHNNMLDFLSLGEGFRLSVGSHNARPMLILEPFMYMRDNRSVLAKLKRAHDARENLNDQVRGILAINRFGITSHRVNDIAQHCCPMFTDVIPGTSFLPFLENHGLKINHPYQPMLTTTYLEEVTGMRGELLMVPEICDEIKPLMVTKKHLWTESTKKILGSLEEWNARMECFVERINSTLGDALKSWKLSIDGKRDDQLFTKPECGVVDSSGWFPDH